MGAQPPGRVQPFLGAVGKQQQEEWCPSVYSLINLRKYLLSTYYVLWGQGGEQDMFPFRDAYRLTRKAGDRWEEGNPG